MTISETSADTEGGFRVEEYGRRDDAQLFLSLCIPTYRRAPKLRRLLGQLQRVLGESAYKDVVEVLVSNNASPDDTAEVVRSEIGGLAVHCAVRVFTQAGNIGAGPNFRFLYEHATGRYVWIFPDDDILYDREFDRLISHLQQVEPEVCLSSFDQPPWSENALMFPCGGNDTELVVDLAAAIPHLVRFPKVTAYVHRRRTLTSSQHALNVESERTTSFCFVTLSLLLLHDYDCRLLLRAPQIARSDEDYLDLNFSPRVYLTMPLAVRLGLRGNPATEALVSLVEIPDIPLTVVGLLFRHSVGLSTVDAGVAESDYRYVRQNLWAMATHGWRNLVKVIVILALYPLIGRRRRRPTH